MSVELTYKLSQMIEEVRKFLTTCYPNYIKLEVEAEEAIEVLNIEKRSEIIDLSASLFLS